MRWTEHRRPRHDRGASPVPGLHRMVLRGRPRLKFGILDGVDRLLVRRVAVEHQTRLSVQEH